MNLYPTLCTANSCKRFIEQERAHFHSWQSWLGLPIGWQEGYLEFRDVGVLSDAVLWLAAANCVFKRRLDGYALLEEHVPFQLLRAN